MAHMEGETTWLTYPASSPVTIFQLMDIRQKKMS